MNGNEKTTVKKWYTYTTYVDIETGEIITKSEFERNYIKKKSSKNVEINENQQYGIIRYTIESERDRQIKISY